MANTAPTVTLANGVLMPALGLGTARMNDAQAEAVVTAAIEIGYRLIDTAEKYNTERGIARAIQASGVNRDEMFITTKFNSNWHGYEEVQRAFEISAERLETDYIDLLMIHWPMPTLGRFVDAWRGMVTLLEERKVRAIGVSNFKPTHIKRLLDATGVAPHVNQVQLNPKISLPAERSYHAEHSIVTEAWSPLDRGKAANFWSRRLRKLRRRLRGWGPNLLDERVVAGVAERHSKTPAQVVLRWHVQQGMVPIPKTTSPQRLVENFGVFDFELSTVEMAEISSLDRGYERDVDSDKHGH